VEYTGEEERRRQLPAGAPRRNAQGATAGSWRRACDRQRAPSERVRPYSVLAVRFTLRHRRANTRDKPDDHPENPDVAKPGHVDGDHVRDRAVGRPHDGCGLPVCHDGQAGLRERSGRPSTAKYGTPTSARRWLHARPAGQCRGSGATATPHRGPRRRVRKRAAAWSRHGWARGLGARSGRTCRDGRLGRTHPGDLVPHLRPDVGRPARLMCPNMHADSAGRCAPWCRRCRVTPRGLDPPNPAFTDTGPRSRCRFWPPARTLRWQG
jgi:hypothetical protein